MKKERLDVAMVNRGIVPSRELAKRMIMAGIIKVNGEKVYKPSYEVKQSDIIEEIEKPRYVSRGGYKLEGALEEFKIDVKDKVCLDVGVSTGGFTDCLLQRGAKFVYGVDVGIGQIDSKIRTDPRVKVYEKINARYLDKFVEEGKVFFDYRIDLVVMDLSFISLEKVIPSVFNVVGKEVEFVVLIKPQFELEPRYIGKYGIAKEEYHHLALEKIECFIKNKGFNVIGITKSKLKGTDGNQEYFIYFVT
ncbi:MAG: TlyA family RNA methyltransferase [Brevinematales bacterium]|nr:TlyA family RNA methyltransferase [Brevinematales bacterium]